MIIIATNLNICDIIDFTNLIKDKTCFTNNHQAYIDVILTNKPNSIH